jgi:hypothetical protein
VWTNYFNRIHRTAYFTGKSKLLYAVSYRSFSSNGSSDVTVVDESHEDSAIRWNCEALESRKIEAPRRLIGTEY